MKLRARAYKFYNNAWIVLMFQGTLFFSAAAQQQLDTTIVIKEVMRSGLKQNTGDTALYYQGIAFSGIVVNDSSSEQMYHDGLPIDYRNVEPGTLIRKVHESGTIEHGIFSGEKTYINKRGIVRKENYISGILNGSWSEYYENGNIKLTGSYRNGLKEGKWQRFFMDGKVMEEGEYADNEKTGRWLIYDSEGQLMKEVEY